ncbi:hypothetical protein BKA62DRAFT_719827 [Auriculariales sp. MPI-PUGE-AT-0066]|nr:hypothetical protein BKA62DRAFT_719827 [Auriculariales sp. MPI-PUGE-AT-0066]
MPAARHIRSQPASPASSTSSARSSNSSRSRSSETSVSGPGSCRYPGCASTFKRAYEIGRHLTNIHAVRELTHLGDRPYLPAHRQPLIFASDARLIELASRLKNVLRGKKHGDKWFQHVVSYGGYPASAESPVDISTPPVIIAAAAVPLPQAQPLAHAQYLPTPALTPDALFPSELDFLNPDPPHMANTHMVYPPTGGYPMGVYPCADGPLLDQDFNVVVPAVPYAMAPLSSSAPPHDAAEFDPFQLIWTSEMALPPHDDSWCIIPPTTEVPMPYGFPEPCANELGLFNIDPFWSSVAYEA